jgi:uncharacterized alpha-E superfamily protein
MLSRVADALFWMGRYLERAEHTARVLEVTRAILVDLSEVDPEAARAQWQGALFALAMPDTPTERLLFDPSESTSLVGCISRARENARQVREVISNEMWEHVNGAYWALNEARARGLHESLLSKALIDIMNASLHWDGVADGSMSRDEGWLFLKVGKFVERLDESCRLISVRGGGAKAAGAATTPSAENVHWITLLRCLCALEPYKKAYPQRVERKKVLEFLIFDREFPRTVSYSAQVAADFVKHLGELHVSGRPVERAFGKIASRLEYADIDEVERRGPHDFLTELVRDLGDASGQLQRTYFLQ